MAKVGKLAGMIMKNLTAIALKYNTQDDAPSVAAHGNMLLAKEMKSIARRYGVPICTNEKLADDLSQVETSNIIPENLYFPVAKILVRKM